MFTAKFTGLGQHPQVSKEKVYKDIQILLAVIFSSRNSGSARCLRHTLRHF